MADREGKTEKVEKPATRVEKPAFVMAEGKALTTKKGIKGPGDGIKPEWLAGGEKAFEAFKTSKHIVKG